MNFHKIESTNLSNGLGWRVVLWVSGCSHHCSGCHNPETWDAESGRPFTEAEMRKLISLLENPYIKGLTLSGGDPLFEGNREAVEQIVKNVKLLCPTKDIWLYTGYEYDEIKDLEILKYVDVLVDGKYIQEQRDITLAFRGSKNQKIIYLENKDDYKSKFTHS